MCLKPLIRCLAESKRADLTNGGGVMGKQQGFTLIELVMVIVILGILAAVAVPKFVDLTGDADQAAVKGVAGALSSASVANYAAKKANSANGSAVADCTAVGALVNPAVPTGSISGGAITVDEAVTCTVTGGSSKTATFTALGI
jgi:MSHA pilin protein MshA